MRLLKEKEVNRKENIWPWYWKKQGIFCSNSICGSPYLRTDF